MEHIRSLRLRPGEPFIVCDGGGTDHVCILGGKGGVIAGLESEFGSGPDGHAAGALRRDSGGSLAMIVESRPSAGEPMVKCTVYIAFAKGGRLDYAVQKSVELGAYEIVLYPSERCVSIPGDTGKKIARLQKIAFETAKQCGRGRVPVVTAADSFIDAVDGASYKLKNANGKFSENNDAAGNLSIFCYEGEKEKGLKQVLEQYDYMRPGKNGGGETTGSADSRDIFGSISIMTGPEGGFSPEEAELARSAGMAAVSLGPRILRCETAPAAVLAAIMFHTGNMG